MITKAKAPAGKRPAVYFLLLAGPAVFMLLFFYYPLSSILTGGLTDDQGHFSLQRVTGILQDPYYLRIIGFTIWQALLSTLLSVLLGLPGAYLLARVDFRGKRIVRALTTIPFILPSIIVVLGFVRFFGNNGILNRFFMSLFRLDDPPLRILYSLKAILLAHGFYNFPICIRIVSALWSRINPHLEEAARSLGARGMRLFFKITLPQIMPGILASAALIFIFCFMSFAVVLVLGGGPRYTTLEVEVYRLAKVSLDLKAGSALALIGSALSLLFLYIYIKLQRKSSQAGELQADFEKKKLFDLLKKPYGLLFLVYIIAVFIIILGPILTVIVQSFQRRMGWAGKLSLSLEWYRRLLFDSTAYLRAVLNSLFFGFMTVVLALPLGTLFAYLAVKKKLKAAQFFEALMMLPMGISSIILGLGYLKAFQVLPWPLVGRWYTIVFAHTVIAHPFVIRTVSSMLRKIKPTLPEAARSLGATSFKLFWHLELPLIKSSLITGAAFAFAISVGEINATLMLYNPDLITMPVAIYRLISSYNFFGACAMGFLLMFFSFLAFLVIDTLGGEVA